MAVGDVISDIQAIGAGGTLTFQPAAGIEVMISDALSNETTQGKCSASMTNGTQSIIWKECLYTILKPMTKIFINNTNYLAITTTDAQNCGYTGIQIK